jgi:hypothetical protein
MLIYQMMRCIFLLLMITYDTIIDFEKDFYDVRVSPLVPPNRRRQECR